MKTEEFDYYLPKELIAQTPLEKRDESRLLVMDRVTGDLTHKHFYDVIDYLNKGDALVINDTKVIPARIIGIKEETGAVIELLLLNPEEKDIWKCLAKPQKRLKEGTIITFGDGSLKAKVIKIKEEGITEVELIYNGILMEILEKLGTMPLPPYIHEKLENKDMYQTVYAKEYGSAAAPTAGLHFTPELLKKIEEKGIKIVHITLHVGLADGLRAVAFLVFEARGSPDDAHSVGRGGQRGQRREQVGTVRGVEFEGPEWPVQGRHRVLLVDHGGSCAHQRCENPKNSDGEFVICSE